MLALAGSLLAGYLFAKAWLLLSRRVQEAPSAIILQFSGAFTVWIVAERIGLSGILTIVAYGITIAQTAPARTPARLRVPAYAVWETAVFILNVLAFMLIGMQLRPIWTRLDDLVRTEYVAIAAYVLAAVILTRVVWVMSYGVMLRTLVAQGLLHPRNQAVPTVKAASWWRGAACAASSRSRRRLRCRKAFPYRDLILLTAFSVVLGSLVIQGLTLRPLIVALQLKQDDPVAVEVARARAIAFRAALDEIEGDPSEEAEILRLEYRAHADARRKRSRWRHPNRRASGRSAAPARDRRGPPLDPHLAPLGRNRRRRLPSARGRTRPRGIKCAGVSCVTKRLPCR